MTKTHTSCPYCHAGFSFPPRAEMLEQAKDRIREFDVAGSDADGDAGVVSTCHKCRGVVVFDPDMQLRKPTIREIAQLKSNAEGWAILQNGGESC